MEVELIAETTLHAFTNRILQARVEGWEVDMEEDIPVFTGLLFTAKLVKGSVKKAGRPKKEG